MTDHEKSTNIPPIIPIISLCTGYSGIEFGLERALGNIRCIAMVEREAFLCALLCNKMEEGLLEPCPVFTNVDSFPWEEFRPIMDGGILTFGWPCQPVSSIGKREGVKDERWLFAENVEGLLSAKMPDGRLVIGHCLERLEGLDYEVEVGIFSAEEVHSPHRRKRIWLLARKKGLEFEWASNEKSNLAEFEEKIKRREFYSTEWPSRPSEDQFDWEEPRVILAAPKGGQSRRKDPQQGGEDIKSGSEEVVDSAGKRLCGNLQAEGRDVKEGSGLQREERNTKPLLGGESDAGETCKVVSAVFNVDPNLRKLDRLRALGNGVIPDCATKAFIVLFNRLMERS